LKAGHRLAGADRPDDEAPKAAILLVLPGDRRRGVIPG